MVFISITPEIYLNDLKIFAGGLGVLESDKFYAAGDMDLNYVVLTLLYTDGYISIDFNNDDVIVKSQSIDKSIFDKLIREDVFKITVANREVVVQPWIYRYKKARTVLFEVIEPDDIRRIVSRLYVEDSVEQQFIKYSVLAKSSLYYIQNNIGIDNVELIDLQESLSGLIIFMFKNIEKLRLVIHTPGPWGHPVYPVEYLEREYNVAISDSNKYVNMTEYLLRKLGKANTVSEKQRDVLSKIYPEFSNKFHAITNGIYLERWMNRELYERYLKQEFTLDVLEKTRSECKNKLNELLSLYKDIDISDKIVITWVRRLVKYKRPYFIAKFIEEKRDLNNVVFIVGGKPHPKDIDGLNYARWFRKLHLKYDNVVYIHDYDVDKAKTIIQASDVFLFTPFSGWEACGTSYMKALVNGIPVLSSRDGGVVELVRDFYNGWLFGDDIRSFINIYTDKRAEIIDENDYREFSSKLLSIFNIYNYNRNCYWSIALNAFRETPSRVDVRNVLKKYYLDKTI
ncbi:MAG: glycogen/starch/alpha-glucan phosphorylase [Desulfurococcaceae archaeon]